VHLYLDFFEKYIPGLRFNDELFFELEGLERCVSGHADVRSSLYNNLDHGASAA
jgi:hypothetical protein